MDRINSEIFSPVHNMDKEKTRRRSDSFSKFLKGPDDYKISIANLENVENVDKNIEKSSSKKSIRTLSKDSEIFSPVHNKDEEKIKRRSDSFSKFLKGPDDFKISFANLKNVENVDKTIAKKSSSKKSIKTLSTKSDILEKDKALKSRPSIHDIAFTASPGKSSSHKKDKSENSSTLTSKRSKDFPINSTVEKISGLKRSDQNKTKRDYFSYQVKNNSENLVKSSLHSGATDASKTSKSKEVKKTDESSSINQRNPLSKIHSGVLEKIINNAVESQVDVIREMMWSHYTDLLKTIYAVKEDLEERHNSESTTMFKIIEQLLEENRLLRNAILARQ